MASFDFISDEKFRASLESDYREIEEALGAKAWKAVHVLAGSIIEAVLADYLLSIGYYEEQRALNPKAKDTAIDPLKMSLGVLIEACKANGILTQRSVALSTVVQGYRNLIHPGRAIRLQESVNENTATVAKALVEMIVGEVSTKRQQTFGPTTVQVVKKVVQDPDAVVYIDHLLRDMSASELERLLVYELPNTYLRELESARQEEIHGECPPSTSFNALKPTFRAAYERATDAIRAKVVRRFVTILKEESQQTVADYEDAFFEASILRYLPGDEGQHEISLVKQQLFVRLENHRVPGDALMQWTTGLGHYIETEDEAKHLAWCLSNQLVSQYNDIQPYDAQLTWDLLAAEMKSRPEVRAAFVKKVNSFLSRREEHSMQTHDTDQNYWLDTARPIFYSEQGADEQDT